MRVFKLPCLEAIQQQVKECFAPNSSHVCSNVQVSLVGWWCFWKLHFQPWSTLCCNPAYEGCISGGSRCRQPAGRGRRRTENCSQSELTTRIPTAWREKFNKALIGQKLTLQRSEQQSKASPWRWELLNMHVSHVTGSKPNLNLLLII